MTYRNESDGPVDELSLLAEQLRPGRGGGKGIT